MARAWLATAVAPRITMEGGGMPPVVVLCHIFLFRGVTLVAAGCSRWNKEARDDVRGHYDGMGCFAGFGPDRQLHAE
jgi:hypothetical protein